MRAISLLGNNVGVDGLDAPAGAAPARAPTAERRCRRLCSRVSAGTVVLYRPWRSTEIASHRCNKNHIRVAEQAARAGNLDAAEHQFLPGTARPRRIPGRPDFIVVISLQDRTGRVGLRVVTCLVADPNQSRKFPLLSIALASSVMLSSGPARHAARSDASETSAAFVRIRPHRAAAFNDSPPPRALTYPSRIASTTAVIIAISSINRANSIVPSRPRRTFTHSIVIARARGDCNQPIEHALRARSATHRQKLDALVVPLARLMMLVRSCNDDKDSVDSRV